MKVKIEATLKKLNDLIDDSHNLANATEIMQASQAVLNLTHAAATLNEIKKDQR